ncbi:MAG: hypothetical protein JXA74_06610, partial [Anaerolineae bacterium]|nr:hypothetical protein [Anaerolineae bacterium]
MTESRPISRVGRRRRLWQVFPGSSGGCGGLCDRTSANLAGRSTRLFFILKQGALHRQNLPRLSTTQGRALHWPTGRPDHPGDGLIPAHALKVQNIVRLHIGESAPIGTRRQVQQVRWTHRGRLCRAGRQLDARASPDVQVALLD